METEIYPSSERIDVRGKYIPLIWRGPLQLTYIQFAYTERVKLAGEVLFERTVVWYRGIHRDDKAGEIFDNFVDEAI